MAEDRPQQASSTSLETEQVPVVSRGSLVSAERHPCLVVLAGIAQGQVHRLGPHQVIGRSGTGLIEIPETGVSRRHCAVRVDGGGKVFVEDLESTNGTYVNNLRVAGRTRVEEGDKIRIGSSCVLKLTYQDALEERLQRQLYDSALRDGLTGLFNRRHFDERIEAELAFHERHRHPLSLILVDLDHFKAVNDRYTHLAGDAVLKAAAEIFQAACRREDLCARVGGEEFAILCRNVPARGGGALAERLRGTLRERPIPWDRATLRVTASFGVAALPDLDLATAQDLYQAADEQLYAAKNAGRDRVRVRGA